MLAEKSGEIACSFQVQGSGSDDHAVHAEVERAPRGRLGANPAAEFDREAHRANNGRDGVELTRLAVLRALQVHDVEILRAPRFPMAGHRRGLVTEHGLAVVVALDQADAFAADFKARHTISIADAFAAAEVNCGEDIHH